MKQEDIEALTGESMEDMGLQEHIEERECECGHLIEDGNQGTLCLKCREHGWATK